MNKTNNKVMNNNMILNVREVKTGTVMNALMATAQCPLQLLANYYGRMLGRSVTMRQTLSLVNAQLAFVMTVFTVMSPLLRCLCLMWLVGSLLKCRSELSQTPTHSNS